MKIKHLFLILCCLAVAACASDAPAPQPPEDVAPAEPAGAVRNAPAPGGDQNQPTTGPATGKVQNVVVPDNAEVTITKKQDTTIEEYRVGGRLYMIKVTPKHGKPYYLIDEQGDGRFARRSPSTFMISPPMWVIKKF